MAIIIKGKTFTSTEQVTSTKLHQLVDDATFDAAAADGSTLEVSAGALRIKDAGVTGDKLSATVAIPTGATAVTQAADTDTTAVATCAFAKAEADAAQTAAIAASCQRASNLSDVASASTARTNLGLTSFASASFYTSADQTFTASSTITVAHGLGLVPKLWKATIRCKTAEHGYSIGDELSVDFIGGDATSLVNAGVNATNFFFVVYPSGVRIINKSSFGIATATPANWALVFRAIAL